MTQGLLGSIAITNVAQDLNAAQKRTVCVSQRSACRVEDLTQAWLFEVTPLRCARGQESFVRTGWRGLDKTMKHFIAGSANQLGERQSKYLAGGSIGAVYPTLGIKDKYGVWHRVERQLPFPFAGQNLFMKSGFFVPVCFLFQDMAYRQREEVKSVLKNIVSRSSLDVLDCGLISQSSGDYDEWNLLP